MLEVLRTGKKGGSQKEGALASFSQVRRWRRRGRADPPDLHRAEGAERERPNTRESDHVPSVEGKGPSRVASVEKQIPGEGAKKFEKERKNRLSP